MEADLPLGNKWFRLPIRDLCALFFFFFFFSVEVGYRHNVLKTRTEDEMTRKREEGPEVSMIYVHCKSLTGSRERQVGM